MVEQVLKKKDRQRIIEILKSGEELPIDYKHVLFLPKKKEYELIFTRMVTKKDTFIGTMQGGASELKKK